MGIVWYQMKDSKDIYEIKLCGANWSSTKYTKNLRKEMVIYSKLVNRKFNKRTKSR